MIHEIAVFLLRFASLASCVALGAMLGGLWAMTAVFRADAPAVIARALPSSNAIERALDAEEAFADAWPGQGYAIRWWGWSGVTVQAVDEPTKTKPGHIEEAMTEAITKPVENISAQVEPWLRLAWIRGVGAIGILVAGLLPAMAWWFVGRQEAYRLHMDTDTPSDGHRGTWVGIAVALAVVAGVLVGAPIGSAMGPWIAIVLLGSLATIYKIRASMAARL